MNKPKCFRCGYKGAPHKENGNDICPHCKGENCFEEDDSVGPDDYREQNPIEPVNE